MHTSLHHTYACKCMLYKAEEAAQVDLPGLQC